MSRCYAWAFAAVAVVVAPLPLRADPVSDASEAFREGVHLYGLQQYRDARAAFESAYRLAPDARVLANIGACLDGEGQRALAVRAYRRFLSEADEAIGDAALGRVQTEIARLAPSVADLTISAEPVGAQVLVDGEAVGSAPLPHAVAVEPGPHTIEVRAQGRQPMTRQVLVAAAQVETVTLVLPPAPSPVPSPAALSAAAEATQEIREPEAALGDTPPGRGPFLWAGVGLTTALALGTAVIGSLVISRSGEYEDGSTAVSRRFEIHDSQQTLVDVADVLFISTLLSAAATAALYLLGGPSGPLTYRSADFSGASVALRPR